MFLREYRAADFEALYALDRLCFEPRFRFSRAMMRRVVDGAGALVRVACEGEEMVGFVAVEVEGEVGYVATLDVAPAWRGRGVGRQLMQAAETESGVRAMVLHVFVGNAAAVRLYEGMGYERVRRERGFYGVGWDAWVYRNGLG